VVGLALVLSAHSSGPWVTWLGKVVTAAAFAVPYFLYRFSARFAAPSRRLDRVAASIASLVVALVVVVPGPALHDGGLVLWTPGYGAVFVAGWSVLSAMAIVRFSRAGAHQPPLARNRTHLMSLGVLLLGAAVGVVAVPVRPSTGPVVAAEIAALLGALSLYAGFVAPKVLRDRWRRSELAAFFTSDPVAMTANRAEEMSDWFLRWVRRLMGAHAAFLVDDAKGILRASNIDTAEAARRQSELAEAGPDGTSKVGALLGRRLNGGWLVVVLSVASPSIGSDEVDLLGRLGARADLVLGFAALLDAERSGREQLTASERDLAEAQELAHLGSWRWDFSDDRVVLSTQMCRLLGREWAATELGWPELLGYLHTEDREVFRLQLQTARQHMVPFTSEHRICRSDGSVHHVRTNARVECDGEGRPLRVKASSQDITEQKNAEEALAHSAFHDELTGLPNRRLFLDRLEQALLDRRRGPARLAVLFLDLDRFKWINDSLGHGAGDKLLVTVTHRLEGAVRTGDTVARFGGDEFMVLCKGVAGESDAVRLAGRLREAISVPYSVEGLEITPSASIGVVVTPARGELEAESLLRDADTAMYQAKESGRDRVAVFGLEARARMRTRLDLDSNLRAALNSGQIEVHYQPEINLDNGEMAGVEALVRWRHPERGLVPPADFIPIAEETGLISQLGALVLASACRQAAEFEAGPIGPITVAVNLSGRQLRDPHLGDQISQVLAWTDIAPDRLRLEITESVLVADGDGSAQVLAGLKDLGVQISVDDFGTGYSSLSYLKRFPVDALKIDRSFVMGVADSAEDHAIVASVIDLARAFGIVTTAEGIETEAQLRTLRRMGCARGQGFYWSPALPPEEISEWVLAHRSPAALSLAAAGPV